MNTAAYRTYVDALAAEMVGLTALYPTREAVASAVSASVPALPAKTAKSLSGNLPSVVDDVTAAISCMLFSRTEPVAETRQAATLAGWSVRSSGLAHPDAFANAAHSLLSSSWSASEPASASSSTAGAWVGPFSFPAHDASLALAKAAAPIEVRTTPAPQPDEPAPLARALVDAGGNADHVGPVLEDAVLRMNSGSLAPQAALGMVLGVAHDLSGRVGPRAGGAPDRILAHPRLAADLVSLLRAVLKVALDSVAAATRPSGKVSKSKGSELDLLLMQLKGLVSRLGGYSVVGLAMLSCGVPVPEFSPVFVKRVAGPLVAQAAKECAQGAAASFAALVLYAVNVRVIGEFVELVEAWRAGPEAHENAVSDLTSAATQASFDLRSLVLASGTNAINAVSPMRTEAQLASASSVAPATLVALAEHALSMHGAGGKRKAKAKAKSKAKSKSKSARRRSSSSKGRKRAKRNP